MAGTAVEPPPARRLPAFAPGNWRSTSVRAAALLTGTAIGNIVLHKTCRHSLFRLPLTQAQTEALAPWLRLTHGSSCATLDASVWRGASSSALRADLHR